LYPGAFYAGTIYCTQIGITKESMLGNEPQAFCYTMKDIDRLPKRVADGNKGTFGKIGFLTGCDTIGGAAVLSATAAYRMGSGYVRVMTHTNNKEGLLQRIPEAVVTCYDDEMGYEERQKLLEQIIQKSDVLAVGAGIGMGEWAYRMVEKLLNRVAKPLVIDADACNIIAASETCKTWLKETSQSRKYPIIMTPHLAEFSRLCGVSITALKEDFPKAVTQFAKEYGVVLVGKDACTLISDCGGRLYMNRSGNDALATAGSGDVLLGMIASLLGQGMSAFDAACMGVYLHGLCGDFAKAETNARFVIASDISLQLAKLPI
jgi:NAD(P)H-hydrate epimerase